MRPNILHPQSSVPFEAPAFMYAGFSYSYWIQGRDEYSNNVDYLLEDAVGTDVSLTYTHKKLKRVKVEGEIVDDMIGPGVYRAKIELPKTLDDGTFKITALLGGSKVPVPNVPVYPCTNFEAAKRRLIISAGDEIVLDPVAYADGDEAIVIDLPHVWYYCKHTPVVMLVKAQRLTQREPQMLTDVDVLAAEYGITLDGWAKKP